MSDETANLSALLRGVFEHSPTAIYMHDTAGRWVFANAECCRALSITPEAVASRTAVRDTLPPRLADAVLRNDHAVIAYGEVITVHEDVLDPETGEVYRYLSVKFPVRDAAGVVIGAGGISFDVSERYRAERELHSAQALVATVFSAARFGIYVMGPDPGGSDARVIECNEAFCTMLAQTRAELVGRSGASLIHPDDEDEYEAMLAAVRAGGSPVTELRYLRGDGSYVWGMAVPAQADSPDGETLQVLQVVDVTERRAFEAQLRHLADHDGLTDLLSRRRFVEMLEAEVVRVAEDDAESAVLLLDLDGFKYVNDALGHQTGDALLRKLGAAIAEVVRESDLLARIGGDEFAVLLPQTGIEGAIEVGRKVVEAVHRNGIVTGPSGRVEVTASVGLTSWNRETQTDAETILAEADIAMYDAKDAGKNRVSVYARNDRRKPAVGGRGGRVAQLRDAVEGGRFVLHAQPIVSLADRKGGVGHYELLVRMRRDDGKLLLPGEFLPDALRHGMIGDIDHWVLAEAVSMTKAMRERGRWVGFSVNLSAPTVEDSELGDRILSLLRDNSAPPELLTIELTDTGTVSDMGAARSLALELKEMGCRLALDSFGAEFATVRYLRDIEFDQVKIDGEFIRNLPQSPADQLIVKAVADMAAGFGAEVVGEYVENRETAELLRSLGIGYGQGYFLGRPGPLSTWEPADTVRRRGRVHAANGNGGEHGPVAGTSGSLRDPPPPDLTDYARFLNVRSETLRPSPHTTSTAGAGAANGAPPAVERPEAGEPETAPPAAPEPAAPLELVAGPQPAAPLEPAAGPEPVAEPESAAGPEPIAEPESAAGPEPAAAAPGTGEPAPPGPTREPPASTSSPEPPAPTPEPPSTPSPEPPAPTPEPPAPEEPIGPESEILRPPTPAEVREALAEAVHDLALLPLAPVGLAARIVRRRLGL